MSGTKGLHADAVIEKLNLKVATDNPVNERIPPRPSKVLLDIIVMTFRIPFAAILLLVVPRIWEVSRSTAAEPASLPAVSKFDSSIAPEVQQAWARFLNKNVEATNGIGMKFRLIPPGEFQMGSPETEGNREKDEKQHLVRITRPFYLAKFEVTRGEFRRFVAAAKYKTEAERNRKGGGGYTHDQKAPFAQRSEFTWLKTGYDQADDHPVVNVSWNDAKAFCDWLGQQDGNVYRLPTEAEWEYACRAGTTTRWHGGETEKDLSLVGNIADQSLKASYPDVSWARAWDDHAPFTAPIGRFRANAFGLHDMHGNVYEWCQDRYDAKYYETAPVEDPPGPADGKNRVLRGGTWFFDPYFARSANRNSIPQDDCGFNIGFRVVIEVEKKK